ncbi:hypothetical protein GCM10027091_04550 [Streptomyces daliensis]
MPRTFTHVPHYAYCHCFVCVSVTTPGEANSSDPATSGLSFPPEHGEGFSRSFPSTRPEMAPVAQPQDSGSLLEVFLAALGGIEEEFHQQWSARMKAGRA